MPLIIDESRNLRISRACRSAACKVALGLAEVPGFLSDPFTSTYTCACSNTGCNRLKQIKMANNRFLITVYLPLVRAGKQEDKYINTPAFDNVSIYYYDGGYYYLCIPAISHLALFAMQKGLPARIQGDFRYPITLTCDVETNETCNYIYTRRLPIKMATIDNDTNPGFPV